MGSENYRLRLRIYCSIFVAVMALGPIGFMAAEDLSFVDALYFTVVTIATVGYGDISPATPAGKLLDVVLIVAGVGTFVGVVANATELLLNRRDEQTRHKKLHMLIGLFFSEAGSRLLALFVQADPRRLHLTEDLAVGEDWQPQQFLNARQRLDSHPFAVDLAAVDLDQLRQLLNRHGDLFVRLLESPYMLEHESFTDLLIAILHLKEELLHRDGFADLPETDQQHLVGDVRRVYILLAGQWLSYASHLLDHYPFLYSLAMRTNPFNRNASAIVR